MSNTTATRSIQSTLGAKRFVPALAAGLLGLFILYGVGFAPHLAHSVAHDSRHAAAFPCH